MRAGKLRHRVTIQELVETKNEDTGLSDESWRTFAQNIPAEIKPLSVREFIRAGAEVSKISTYITTRHIPGVKRSMRIVHGSRTYNIEGVLPDADSGIEYMTMPVSEVLDD